MAKRYACYGIYWFDNDSAYLRAAFLWAKTEFAPEKITWRDLAELAELRAQLEGRL